MSWPPWEPSGTTTPQNDRFLRIQVDEETIPDCKHIGAKSVCRVSLSTRQTYLPPFLRPTNAYLVCLGLGSALERYPLPPSPSLRPRCLYTLGSVLP